ncbi:MAG: hypothetical protein ACLUW4_01075 [Butyribacter sp.]|uniref:hypothetical protein n=1 Tax=Butyribacter sp. TaxID=2822465 RepID=UPI00399D09FE
MGRNKEGYPDSTASIAVGRAAKQEKNKEGKKNVHISRKFKNGQKVQLHGNVRG